LKHKLPYKERREIIIAQYCNFTAKELAKLTGEDPHYVREYCRKHGLNLKRERKSYVYHDYSNPPAWYDPNKTASEMIELADCSPAAVKLYLINHKLPYKKVYNLLPVDKWYNPNLTIKQMSEASGKSERAIAIYIQRHNLKCNKKVYKTRKSWQEKPTESL